MRPRRVWDHLRGSLWGLPSVAVACAGAAGLFLAQYRVPEDSLLSWFAYDGGADGARSVLQVISGSTITVTSLVFSLTVVALQMAASQYSPRLLNGFVRDLGNQVTLAVFLSTFIFSLLVLPSVRSAGEDVAPFVPELAVTVALVLATASVGALVFFIHHVTRSLRIEAITRRVRDETLASIARNTDRTLPYWAHIDERLRDRSGEVHTEISAPRSGYIRSVDTARLVQVGVTHDVRIRFRRSIGEYVAEGTVLAWVFCGPDRAITAETAIQVERRVVRATRISFERSMQEDVGFGLRQLIDIAIKAVSPAMNDPTTSIAAIGHLSVALQELAHRPLGGKRYRRDGHTFVEVPRPIFSDYLDLVISPISHYGSGDVTVLLRLLQLLEDLVAATKEEGRHAAVMTAIDHVVDVGEHALTSGWERERLETAAGNVRAAVGADGAVRL